MPLVLERFPALPTSEPIKHVAMKMAQAIVDLPVEERVQALKVMIENYPMLHQAVNAYPLQPGFLDLCKAFDQRFPHHKNYLLVNGVDFDVDQVDLHRLIEMALAVKTRKLTDVKKEELSRTLAIPSFTKGKGGKTGLVCPSNFVLTLANRNVDQSQPSLLQVNGILNIISRPFPKAFLLLYKMNQMGLLQGQVCMNVPPHTHDYPFKNFLSLDGQPPLLASDRTLMSVKVSVPHAWLTVIDERTDDDIDVDNVRLADFGDHKLQIVYRLKHLITEAQVFTYDNTKQVHDPPIGEPVRLLTAGSNEMVDETTITQHGYMQLKTPPGEHRISAMGHGMTVRTDSLSPISFQFVIDAREAVLNDQIATADTHVNVFTVTSGKPYERLALIMMLSVSKNFKDVGKGRKLKFWLLDQFVSPQFRHDVQKLSGAHHFEYAMLSYKFPSWMWPQKVQGRHAKTFKILFLDLLFPRHLPRVVFVDADQVARADLADLYDEDVKGQVYGLTPFCDDLPEAEPYSFWKHNGSYWHSYLKGRPYFIR